MAPHFIHSTTPTLLLLRCEAQVPFKFADWPLTQFEKSLYDLIRGLRNHKGNEKEYIQTSLKECRAEIRGQDMDLKATALLKLVYLEMFGHDMSWASFHVLEVMSSPKYLQKRVGYLGAVQSFRPDTEVLMLATNLLKKDITATSINTMSLPIITLPHILTSSLGMSVLSDLLPRLTHSSPVIRKKTIVTLYRLALVYPETLRPAWPKIKERLMDESEDPAVTAAIINVVCELGWRRPQDFLPLAPRLFELLVDGGNNWMAIKLIKLFATLTPLEPRLVKKLLPPLTSIIRTTPAMSLLYECIHGIIQGNILSGSDDTAGEEEIASLCVGKLRSMIMVEGDPNLKYVALLAFNKIVLTHPFLVAQQEDVIMECIDSADISIRLRALDLVVGMVSPDNLMSIVGRLMRQLRNSPSMTENELHPTVAPIEPAADSDDEAPEAAIRPDKGASQDPLLPDDYKFDVIHRILQMCASDNYGNLVDFDWYVDVLTQLVRSAPEPSASSDPNLDDLSTAADLVSFKIGDELRNVAVKVRAIRPQATIAAEDILLAMSDETTSAFSSNIGALRPIAWIIGEFAPCLASPQNALTALVQISKSTTCADGLVLYLQSALKILSLILGRQEIAWTASRKSIVALLMARVLHMLEPLATHPSLEVQERAAGFLELIKLAAEASSAQEVSPDAEPPLLLTQAMPALFTGMELNSVATGAQRNVPIPEDVDLDRPINSNLSNLLREADHASFPEANDDEFEVYYHHMPKGAPNGNEPAITRRDFPAEGIAQSYQGSEESYLDPDIVARRRAERLEKNKDDPFYIAGVESPGRATPIHNILRNNNGTDLDIDSIPIMQLDLGKSLSLHDPPSPFIKPTTRRTRQHIEIAADEDLSSGKSTPQDDSTGVSESNSKPSIAKNKGKQSLLQVDSSHLGAISLEVDDMSGGPIDYERQLREDAEMAQAMREVERLRLEMQRANERIKAKEDVPTMVVKKKIRKKKSTKMEPRLEATDRGDEVTSAKPKKKARAKQSDVHDGADGETLGLDQEETEEARPKKKKKKKKREAPVQEEGDPRGDMFPEQPV